LKWLWLAIFTLIGSLGFLPAVAQAQVTANITLFATPLWSAGIASFTVTYVNETALSLNWTYGSNVTGVMIRAKYGVYPADIATESETPSDGYLVYTGTGTSINDTSMDFDTNPGPIYYRAWAYRADGSWVITPSQGSEESAIMTLLAFFLLPGIVSFLCMRSSYPILKFCAGVAWWVAAFYWNTNPPSSVVVGSSVHTLMLDLLGVIGVAFVIYVFWNTKRENGVERGRFHLPFTQTDEEAEQERARERYYASHSERAASHMARVNAARRGEVTRR